MSSSGHSEFEISLCHLKPGVKEKMVVNYLVKNLKTKARLGGTHLYSAALRKQENRQQDPVKKEELAVSIEGSAG